MQYVIIEGLFHFHVWSFMNKQIFQDIDLEKYDIKLTRLEAPI